MILYDGYLVGLGHGCSIPIHDLRRILEEGSLVHRTEAKHIVAENLAFLGAHQERGLHRDAPASSGGAAVPHMGAKMYLQVPLGGERPTAHVTLEGFLPRVGADVDLQCTVRLKLLAADVATVLQSRAFGRGRTAGFRDRTFQ